MTASRGSKREPNWGLGIAIGMAIGVSFSVALDNWAFIGMGAAFAAAFAYLFGSAEQPDDGDGSSDGPAG